MIWFQIKQSIKWLINALILVKIKLHSYSPWFCNERVIQHLRHVGTSRFWGSLLRFPAEVPCWGSLVRFLGKVLSWGSLRFLALKGGNELKLIILQLITQNWVEFKPRKSIDKLHPQQPSSPKRLSAFRICKSTQNTNTLWLHKTKVEWVTGLSLKHAAGCKRAEIWG